MVDRLIVVCVFVVVLYMVLLKGSRFWWDAREVNTVGTLQYFLDLFLKT